MSSCSESCTLPEGITSVFLQDVLKEYFKDDNLQVCDVVFKCIFNSEIGSEMHRAVFTLKRNGLTAKFSLIIKHQPKGYNGVVAHKCKLFTREIMAYKEVLPRVKALLASIGDTSKIAAACYYATETPQPFLILEDISLNGFVNYEKGCLLNLEHILSTVEKVAKLHACSAVIAAENIKIMDLFKEAHTSHNPDRKKSLEFYPTNMRCVAEVMSQWDGYEKIAEKMFKLSAHVLQCAEDMYAEHENSFRVFNMADLWIDSLMFHLDHHTKLPSDVVLLDFQFAYYGSPAMDLNYLLYGSLNENVREVHMKYIVRHYHTILTDVLEKLHYKGKIPTLKYMTIEMIKNSLQAVIAATCLTPFIFMEKSNFDTIQKFLSCTKEGDAIRRQNIEHPKCKAFLQHTLDEFATNGFLDV